MINNPDSASFKPYTYTHEVRAAKVEAITRAADGSAVLTLHGGQEWVVSPAWVRNYNPSAGGYLVVHENGPTVFSTAENFESNHKLKTD